MTFYQKSAATALKLITKFGQTVTIKRVVSTPDPVTGSATSMEVNGTLKAVVLPVASTAKSLFTEADNNLREALIRGKIRFILAAASGATFQPVANDVVVVGSETYTLIGCAPLNPAGTPLVYKMAGLLTGASPDFADLGDVTWEDLENL